MKLILFSCFTVFLFLILSSCDTNEPLPQGALGLTLEDVSCTEAWITLTVGNLPGTAYIRITSNGNLIETLDVNATKTLLYYDTLLPNTTYEFQAFSSQRGEDIIGNKLQVTTLDTTSHNFTWQTFEFGQHSSSVLYDVAIIDENNIWAVGEIYMNDSLGNPDPTFYNAAHWDGQNWELKKLFYKGGIWIIRTVFAFNENDIWFSGFMRYLNGNFIELPIPNILMGWSINKLWGSSNNDLYIVGNGGNIAHYQNGSWTKIESGTSLPINDIYGRENPEIEKLEIICVASDAFTNNGVSVIKINSSNTVEQVNTSGLKWSISSVWFLPGYKYFIVGNGLFNNSALGSSWSDLNENRTITPNYMDFIRGTGFNNIIVVGAFGEVIHFNGMHWKSIKDDQTTLTNGSYFKVDIKENIMAAVGYNLNKAVVLIGKHN